jgi:Ca2+-binding EF-hand superfamily protein
MKTTILTATLLALVPAALFAATNATPNNGAPARPAWGDHGLFNRFDTNKDGVVSKDEAQAAATAQVDKVFAELDTNQDGQITQDEVKAAHDARRAEMEAKFEAKFKQADTNGDGMLSKDEVQAGMPMLARGFDRIDANKDGQLTLDEIKAGRQGMMRHMRGPRPGSRGGWGDGGPNAHGGPSGSAQSNGSQSNSL